jgi:surfeit locus 1 family protein
MTSKVFKSFRPNKLATIMLFLLTLLFLTLGGWQTRRAAEKSILEELHRTAPPMTLEGAIEQESRFSRISVDGTFDPSRHILLDNQIWQGRAGVYVFTPFYTSTGAAILVNRGWLPLSPDRKSMPEISTPRDELVLRGILNTPPVPGRILGPADSLSVDAWPQLVTYLNLPDIANLLELPLETWIIQLSASEPSGFDGREWKPVFLSSSRHRGYAVQWFALAAAGIIMWLVISFRKPTGNRK